MLLPAGVPWGIKKLLRGRLDRTWQSSNWCRASTSRARSAAMPSISLSVSWRTPAIRQTTGLFDTLDLPARHCRRLPAGDHPAGLHAGQPRFCEGRTGTILFCLQLPTDRLDTERQPGARRPPSMARSCWGVSCSARSTACWLMRTGSGALPPVDSADVVLLVFRRPCAHRLLSWACGYREWLVALTARGPHHAMGRPGDRRQCLGRSRCCGPTSSAAEVASTARRSSRPRFDSTLKSS